MFATAGGDKRGAVLGCGADVFIDYRSEDFQAVVAQATQGRGVDVVIDFIGAPYLQRNVRSLADGGAPGVGGAAGWGAGCGAAHGRGAVPPPADLWHRDEVPPARGQAGLVQRFAQQWLQALAAGVIRPVIDSTFALADAAQAHRRMESGASIGKILLLPEAR